MERAMAMLEAMYRLFALFVLLCAAVVNAAPAADCSVPFNDLMPCIDFVNANSSDPPPALCCTAFSNTQKQHPECLCQLQQAFADPATAPGNITRAAEIPSFCKVAVDYNKCPALLGLAPEPAPMAALAPVKPPRHAPVPAPGPAPRTGKDYDCTNSFTTLASCLDFVSGDGKGGPPKDCCTAIGSTQANEPICICQLLAQVNDSAQFGVNATLAMQLPALCHVTADTSGCPALLDSPLAPSGAPLRAPSPAPVASSPTAPTPLPLPSSPSPSPSSSVDCSNEFALLQSCFAYVMANDTTPPSVECCTALGSVVANQPVCLCQLLQTVGSGDPAVSGINATRALGLADVCRVSTDVGMCPALLGQPVSSPLPSTSSPSSPVSPGEAPGPGASPVVEAPVGEAATAPSRSTASSVVMSSSMVVVLTVAAILWSGVAPASKNCC